MSRNTRYTVRGLSLVLIMAMAGVGTFFLQGWARGEQAEHDARSKEVLKEMSDYYRSMDSLSVRATLDQKAKVQGRSMNTSTAFQFAMERPNKFVMESSEDSRGGGGVVVSDGNTMHVYVPQVDKFTKEKSPESINGVLDV
jgi:outer membrane lipoprotein-sorting protein